MEGGMNMQRKLLGTEAIRMIKKEKENSRKEKERELMREYNSAHLSGSGSEGITLTIQRSIHKRHCPEVLWMAGQSFSEAPSHPPPQ